MFGFQFKSPRRTHVYFMVINDVIARSEISR